VNWCNQGRYGKAADLKTSSEEELPGGEVIAYTPPLCSWRVARIGKGDASLRTLNCHFSVCSKCVKCAKSKTRMIPDEYPTHTVVPSGRIAQTNLQVGAVRHDQSHSELRCTRRG
jgi:hypothetical protein